jgi:quercetin dioxygenase-like cupin family protein/alkylhydroperoxidase/carboxymuconolactone decarboxylase family protein YurZ
MNGGTTRLLTFRQKIKMNIKNLFFTITLLSAVSAAENASPATQEIIANNMSTATNTNNILNNRQRQIVAVAASTAIGNLDALKSGLNAALDAELSINEIKEVLVHISAYAGFPRSLQGINAFMAVLEERKAKGITDEAGKEATPIIGGTGKYERGKKTLEALTGKPETGPKTGFAAFSPEIEVFLKEHLFADIFDRDVLNYSQREMITVATLVSLGGVEPQLRSHLNLALNTGLTAGQLTQLIEVIGNILGKAKADAATPVLKEVLQSRGLSTGVITEAGNGVISGENPDGTMPASLKANQIFTAKGNVGKPFDGPAQWFTGRVRVTPVILGNPAAGFGGAYVTFAPSARTAWHRHPAGQTLLVVKGTAWTCAKNGEKHIAREGDCIWCPPNVTHWHGASPDGEMTHLALTGIKDGKNVEWLEKVTETEYLSGGERVSGQ